MNEDKALKQRYGKENPFRTPEGYFEHLTDSIMSQLPEKTPQQHAPIRMWDRVKPWLYMAAMFVGLMFTARMFMGKYTAKENQGTNTEVSYSVSEIPEEYIEPIVDKAMMDDYQLYEYLTDANPTSY